MKNTTAALLCLPCLPCLLCLLGTQSASAQTCDSTSLLIVEVRASETDANIPFELQKHQTFFNPSCTARNILLVHLVGTIDNPNSTLLFPSLAANNGFHVLSLKYENGVSAQTACGNSTDVDCHLKFRREILEGVDHSTEVSVDSVNSVYNRLIRLLQHMDNTYPGQNWGQYFQNDSVLWDKVMVSGHSQGGGHAAVIAMDHTLKRLLMFASPNDYSNYYSQYVPWVSAAHLTADSVYYSFNNVNDQVADYDWQYNAALSFGQGAFGDTVDVEQVACPYTNTHNLYTSRDSSGWMDNHNMVLLDAFTPMDMTGKPVFQDTWLYMLGLPCATLSIEEQDLKGERKLAKVLDMTGREVEDRTNTLLIHVYSDGTAERVYRVE